MSDSRGSRWQRLRASLTKPVPLSAFYKKLKNPSLVIAMLLAVFLLWILPEVFYKPGLPTATPKAAIELINDTRRTLFQLVGGIFLLLSVVITWRRMTAAEKTLAITQEGNTTDLFVEAIKLLGESGDDKLAMRLGGIYALERIARTSKDDHGSIMEILTAYVRENAPVEDSGEQNKQASESAEPTRITIIKTDIQAILTVLGRRTIAHDRKGSELNLDFTYLRQANLRNANLRLAHFHHANIARANLRGADLAGSLLIGADLRKANLKEANLESANLWQADLTGANLWKANLRNAELWETDLRGAILEKADLTGANINLANVDKHTVLPPSIVREEPPESRKLTERGETSNSGREGVL